MPRDPYDTLGVARDAGDEEIRRAYRRRVQESHPDHTRSPNAGNFREVQEAYETLSDVERKREYDQRAHRAEVGRVREWTGPLRSSAAPHPVSQAFEDPLDVLDRWFPAFRGGWDIPGACATLEIVLTPEEAHRGISLPAAIELRVPCPVCAGRSWFSSLLCPSCGGEGWETRPVQFELRVPPATAHGTRIRYRFRTPEGTDIDVSALVLLEDWE